METVLGGKNLEKKNQIMADLIKYCGLDAYAMYAILEYLMKKVSRIGIDTNLRINTNDTNRL